MSPRLSRTRPSFGAPARLLVAITCTLLAGLAAAGEVKVYRANEAVDPQDVARILEGMVSPADPRAIRSRSIRLLDGAGAPRAARAEPDDDQDGAPPRPAARARLDPVVRTAASQLPRPAPAASGSGASALSLPVQFAFDSADILPSARPQLDALAEGVLLLPEGTLVVIEGHTDTAGSDRYNEQLSLRRAQAVKRYLVAAHGIDPSRLRTAGLGEFAPLAGLPPDAPENRRVQFRGGR